MKFDSKNNVTEIINYRNKVFEYKSDHYDDDYDTKYIVDNINPNESHLYISDGYFESSIIEDYRVTVFVVIKDNTDNIFALYDNSDHSLTLLHIFILNIGDHLALKFTTLIFLIIILYYK